MNLYDTIRDLLVVHKVLLVLDHLVHLSHPITNTIRLMHSFVIRKLSKVANKRSCINCQIRKRTQSQPYNVTLWPGWTSRTRRPVCALQRVVF